MPEVRLAINAIIVVIEVKSTALPTFAIDISADSIGVLPALLSSLYLWRACKLSSIPNAKINIGRRFEN